MRRRTLIRRLAHGLMLLGLALWIALAGMMIDAGMAGQDNGFLARSGGVLIIAGLALWVIANIRDGNSKL